MPGLGRHLRRDHARPQGRGPGGGMAVKTRGHQGYPIRQGGLRGKWGQRGTEPSSRGRPADESGSVRAVARVPTRRGVRRPRPWKHMRGFHCLSGAAAYHAKPNHMRAPGVQTERSQGAWVFGLATIVAGLQPHPDSGRGSRLSVVRRFRSCTRCVPMISIAPTAKDTDTAALGGHLWDPADQFRSKNHDAPSSGSKVPSVRHSPFRTRHLHGVPIEERLDRRHHRSEREIRHGGKRPGCRALLGNN